MRWTGGDQWSTQDVSGHEWQKKKNYTLFLLGNFNDCEMWTVVKEEKQQIETYEM